MIKTECLNAEWLNNEGFVRRFEEDADPSAPFHHADHVRLAFAYLCQYSVLQAIEKFANALKRYAAARGKTKLYHETITYAYLFLIRERMQRNPCASWEEFAQRNPDLVASKTGALERYYRKETLDSEFARDVFVLPDRCA